MSIEHIIKKSELSFDVKKFLQNIDKFSDYNDPLYKIRRMNSKGGSSAHPDLIGEMCKFCGDRIQ